MRRSSARGRDACELRIDLAREDDGRWIGEGAALPGVFCYGATIDEAVAHVQALAPRVLAERLVRAEPAELLHVSLWRSEG